MSRLTPRATSVERSLRACRLHWALPLVTAVLMLTATGCSTLDRILATDPPHPCADHSPAHVGDVTAPGVKVSTIAMLIDTTTLGTFRSSGNPSELENDRKHAVQKVLNTGFDQRATLYVGLINGPGNATLAFDQPFRLDPTGANEGECLDKKAALSEQVLGALDRSTNGPTDVLGGLNMLNLSRIPPSSESGAGQADVDVVILSSMLNNTTELTPDMEQQDPDTVVSALRQNDLWHDCPGWRVYLVGPGRTAERTLGLTELTKLQRFWQSAFHACGGELWGFQPQLTAFPAPGELPGRPGPCTQDIPAGVLFDVDKAEIRPDAEPWLARTIDTVRQDAQVHHSRTVDVVGHTDSDGEEASNQVLSERRAVTVANRIHSSLPDLIVNPTGRGEKDPKAPNDSPEHKANNRRVVVTVAC